VVVDCASLPETLFESELFGHERGAFTGAHAARAGLVEAAHGGTLFLDEVGDIPLTMQVKLLRLLESGTYRRVGQTELRRADIRLVAATHRDLRALVAEGRFREDLYYRLSTFPIRLPALRERVQDIPLLAASLLERVAPGRRLVLAPAAQRRLARHPFPGNVRELRNVLERAAQTVERALGFDSSPPAPAAPAPRATLRGIENAALRAALQPGAPTHAATRREQARALGVSPRTLYRRLRALEQEECEKMIAGRA
jgi:DNA-binding NtrC family response regulator